MSLSYQGPMLIREPELRWPVMLAALIITALVVLLTTAAISTALATPAARPAATPTLGVALRSEVTEFGRFGGQFDRGRGG